MDMLTLMDQMIHKGKHLSEGSNSMMVVGLQAKRTKEITSNGELSLTSLSLASHLSFDVFTLVIMYLHLFLMYLH